MARSLRESNPRAGAWLSQRADVIGRKMLTDALPDMPDGEERAELCAVLAARLKREGDGARASGFEAAKARQFRLGVTLEYR